MNDRRVVPVAMIPMTRHTIPITRPTSVAVVVQHCTARFQTWCSTWLYLTSSGSVASPRDALSTNA